MKKHVELALGADLRAMKNSETSRLRIHFSIDDSLDAESILILKTLNARFTAITQKTFSDNFRFG